MAYSATHRRAHNSLFLCFFLIFINLTYTKQYNIINYYSTYLVLKEVQIPSMEYIRPLKIYVKLKQQTWMTIVLDPKTTINRCFLMG